MEQLREPSYEVDIKKVHEFGELSKRALDSRIYTYRAFLERGDLMPQTRGVAEMVLAHLILELTFRDGVYDE